MLCAQKKPQQTLQQDLCRRAGTDLSRSDTCAVLRLFCCSNSYRGGGVRRLVNRGSEYSWTWSLHLCLQYSGLAFLTFSPVTPEEAAALEITAPPRLLPFLPVRQTAHVRPWKLCLERPDEEFPVGGGGGPHTFSLCSSRG